jgi:hypothetical protein
MVDATVKLGGDDPSVAAAIAGYFARTPVEKWLLADKLVARLPELVRGDAHVKSLLVQVAKKLEVAGRGDDFMARKRRELREKVLAAAR